MELFRSEEMQLCQVGVGSGRDQAGLTADRAHQAAGHRRRRPRRRHHPLLPFTRGPPQLHPQLMIPAEAAHGTIAALGEVGMLQFKDLNADRTAFQRT